MAPLIDARNLVLAYGATRAVDDLSLSCDAGSITAIVGPNGSGKSTLLRGLAGIMKPESGFVRVNGVDLATLTPLARARMLAFVPQRPDLSAPFTAREVVRLGRFSRKPDESRVDEALIAVGLLPRGDHAFDTLSGGERQRVALARAFAQSDDGGALLLDEPFSAIDPKEVARIIEALRRRAQGSAQSNPASGSSIPCVPCAPCAIVLSLHDPGLARAFATHAVLMREGRVLVAGPVARALTTATLSETYGHEMIEQPNWLAPRLT